LILNPVPTGDYNPAIALTLQGPPPGGTATDTAARVSPGDTDSPEAPPPAPAGYDIEEVLGRGGMGVVYLARQRGLNRRVALKMIRDGALASGQELARFRGEAQAVARLQHPNIVQIYEIGEHAGRPYFSLEYLAGGSLDKLLAGKPLPAHEAAALVETLARAVHYAHQHGIIHRDLKPANVLLQPIATKNTKSHENQEEETKAGSSDPSFGDFSCFSWPFLPKITDFGLAKRLDPLPADGVHRGQTQSGAILGTPSYMAPEQAGAKSQEIGPATDVYALGAILYELLTGRPPFLAATALDTLLQVAGQEPVPPSRLQPKLPRDLETVCLKCLQKDPHKRYDSASELADDLQRFLAGEPITARPVGRLERLVRWCRRKPAIAGLLAALVLVFVAGFAGVLWKWRDAEDARAETAKKAAAAEAARRAEEAQKRAAEEARAEAAKKAAAAEDAKHNAEAAQRAEEAQKRTAESLRQQADERRRQAERALSFNRVVLAHRYWLAGNSDRARELLDLCPPRFRRWDWHYLRRLGQAELLTLGGQTGQVDAAAVSPDGRWIASAHSGQGLPGGVVRIWDAANGQVRFAFRAHRSAITALSFSPDSRYLASASRSGTIKLWKAQSGRPETLPPFQHGPKPKRWGMLIAGGEGWSGKNGVTSLAFSPGGNRLASSGHDGTVRIWDTRNGHELRTISAHSSTCNAVAFSPDGRRVASAGAEAQKGPTPEVDGANKPVPLDRGAQWARVWDVRTGNKLLELRHAAAVSSIAFSPRGHDVVTGGRDGTVKLWNAQDGKELKTFRNQTRNIHRVCVSPDGTRVVFAGDDHTVRVWDRTSGRELFALRGHSGTIHSLAYQAHGRRLVSADNSSVKVWEAVAGGQTVLSGGPGLAFSPDGRQLATQGPPQTIKVWDVRTGQLLRSLKGSVSHGSLAFSPDGARLLSAEDYTVTIWDLNTGAKVLAKESRSPVSQAQFSPDGKTLALACLGEPVCIWDAHTGAALRTLGGVAMEGWFLAFNRDGTRLAASLGTSGIRVWEPATGKIVATMWGHMNVVRGAAFNPDGSLLASASDDGTVKVWDARTGRERWTLKGHTGGVRSVAFSPDGRRLASASYGDLHARLARGGLMPEPVPVEDPANHGEFPSGGEVKLWDAETGQELLTMAQAGHILAFSSDGRRLALARMDGTIRIWDATPVRERLTFREAGPCVALSPDGRSLVTADISDGVKVFDTRDPDHVRAFHGHKDMIRATAFHPDGRRVASASEDETVKIWDVEKSKVLVTFRGHGDCVNSVAFSPNGRWAASAGFDRTGRVWDAATGKEISRFTGHADRVLCVAFSGPDGALAASGDDDGAICIWDPRTGRELRRLQKHGESVHGVAFSGDGKYLAAAGDDGTATIWEVHTGRTVRTLRGHTDAVRAVAFSSDGKRLATAGLDQTVRVWNAGDGRLRLTLRGHVGAVLSVAFSADGRTVASAGADMTVRLWDVTTEVP
jgi:WD40 repeat protein/serine/threonine protein kinase